MAVTPHPFIKKSNTFNEKIRSRIFSCSSSSTSSSSCSSTFESDLISPSPCLSHLVQTFLEDGPSAAATAAAHGGEDSISDDPPGPDRVSLLEPILTSNADPFKARLLIHVTTAVEIFAIFRKKSKSMFNRKLMSYLREIGYDAGVCVTRWDATPGGDGTAGKHEFVDVFSPEMKRYIVDGEFSGEFEMVRESEGYRRVRGVVPRVFVGREDEVRVIVRLVCEEARRSMKINGLSLPPWRKNRYMQEKWLGKCRRSLSSFAVVETAACGGCKVKCRAVGFDVGGGGECVRVFFPPVMRTR